MSSTVHGTEGALPVGGERLPAAVSCSYVKAQAATAFVKCSCICPLDVFASTLEHNLKVRGEHDQDAQCERRP